MKCAILRKRKICVFSKFVFLGGCSLIVTGRVQARTFEKLRNYGIMDFSHAMAFLELIPRIERVLLRGNVE